MTLCNKGDTKSLKPNKTNQTNEKKPKKTLKKKDIEMHT